MPDISVHFDGREWRGDWTLTDTDLLTGNDLETNIIVSLFTNQDWWGSTYEPDVWGSRLSELRRAKRSNETLLRARDYCRQALRWLTQDKIARTVNVLTEWRGDMLAIGITIMQATGTTRYSFVWRDIF
jgi:phage gp46-like protein